jgi:hypothetical protein
VLLVSVPLASRALDAKLVQSQLASTAVRRVDHQPSALAVQGDALSADLTHEVDRLSRRLVEREPQLAPRELALQGLAQCALRSEEAIRRHEAIDALVRAKMVVVAHPVRDAPACILEVLGRRALPKLVGHRLPQPLALAQRLGVVRAAHDVRDPLLGEQLLKATLAAPGVVLAALVGEHFLGFAEARDSLEQRLGHQRSTLVCCQGPGHDVATVVVEEDGEVHAPPLASQHEAGDVGLPQLARAGAFEAARRLGSAPWSLLRRSLRAHARLVEHVADRTGRH